MTERNTNWTAICKDAPKIFLNNSNMLLSYDYPPPDALCGGMLSLQIWDTFQKNRLDTKSFAIRVNSWQDLNTYFLTKAGINIGAVGLMIAGSTINGFGLKESDIDLTILRDVIGDSENSFTSKRKSNKLKSKCASNLILDRNFFGFLSHYRGHTKLESFKDWNPILRFKDDQWKMRVDVSYNATGWLKNSHLLFHYSQFDWRVKPLVTVIKLWGKKINSNIGLHNINSFHLTLLVIYFLQAGVDPAILPSLQKLFPQQLGLGMRIENIDFRKLELPLSERVNTQTLEELLLGFFKFYSEFNFEDYVISVRLAKSIKLCDYKIQCKRGPIKFSYNIANKSIYIEEPYELRNAAMNVLSKKKVNKFVQRCLNDYHRLTNTQTLESLSI